MDRLLIIIWLDLAVTATGVACIGVSSRHIRTFARILKEPVFTFKHSLYILDLLRDKKINLRSFKSLKGLSGFFNISARYARNLFGFFSLQAFFALSRNRFIGYMVQSGHYWQSPYVNWVSQFPDSWRLFVFHMREARIKAKVPAVIEALSLWRPFQPVAPVSGPLAEKRGVFWIALDPQFIPSAIGLLPRLGYSFAVDEVLLIDNPEHFSGEHPDGENEQTRWHGVPYSLVRIYQENRENFRNRASDKRVFLLETDSGDVRPVKGYRGDGSALSRRGLPVEDARLLVNLVSPGTLITKDLFFLDPFAGAGGIIIEALDAGYTVYSLDTDKKLRQGLKAFGASHQLADATHQPFTDDIFTAVATEPPYYENTLPLLQDAFDETSRVLKPSGRLSMLVANWQAVPLMEHSATRGMRLFLASPINRKGTDVVVLAWDKVA